MTHSYQLDQPDEMSTVDEPQDAPEPTTDDAPADAPATPSEE